MSRVGLVVATAAIMGVALAGCSALPGWMTPGWMSSSSSPPMQPLQFESDPPGATVQTTQGQTCQTPCSLPVPSESQTVTFSRAGYVTQTVQVSAGPPPEHEFWESPPPTLAPNPVLATLQRVPPLRKPVYRHRRRRRRVVHRRSPVVRIKPRHRSQASPFPNPPPQQRAPSAFPPSPQ